MVNIFSCRHLQDIKWDNSAKVGVISSAPAESAAFRASSIKNIKSAVTSWEGRSGATAIRVWEWENIKWLRRWIRVVQGGEFRVSSLRVKNAVLHDPTDDENEDAEDDTAAI